MGRLARLVCVVAAVLSGDRPDFLGQRVVVLGAPPEAFRVGLALESLRQEEGRVNGAVQGGVKLVLRLEGLVCLALSLIAYERWGLGWGTFAWLFFAPDLSFLGYFAGARVGALSYNLAHSLVGPLLLLALGLVLSSPSALGAGLIWTAHIGMDRALGYGLKYSTGFTATHLGRIGRGQQERAPA